MPPQLSGLTRKQIIAIVAASLVIIIIIIIGASSTSKKNAPNSNANSNATAGSTKLTTQGIQTIQVSINNNAYWQTQIIAKKGSTVVWTNQDSVNQSVTFNDVLPRSSQQLVPGAIYSVVFSQAGTYDYHSSTNLGTRGVVTIVN
jgi:plastocyanin